MRQRIRRLGVWQMAKVMGVLYLLIGAVIAVVFAAIVAGACIAALYNFTARWTGGIEMETGSMEIEPV